MRIIITALPHYGKIRSNGGRVLNATVISDSLKKARESALNALDILDWKNKYYRYTVPL